MDILEKMEYDTLKFRQVDFREHEIITFKSIACTYVLAIATDPMNISSPLFVDLHALSVFIKMHYNYWNRGFNAKSDDSDEQIKILKILMQKVNAVVILARKYNLLMNKTIVDLRNLMHIIKNSNLNNLEILKVERNDSNTMEIEKVMLEDVRIQLLHDIASENILKDIIMFSKFMSYKIYGLYIK
jgi:hypothetical protein